MNHFLASFLDNIYGIDKQHQDNRNQEIKIEPV